MSITRFFVDALQGALDVGLATPDDMIRHVTPDVLAAHLPRPLWSKLLAACLLAPRTDARLVVDTLGVPALCECVPGAILWQIVADVATRALGKGLVAAPPPAPVISPIGPPPPVAPVVVAPAPPPVTPAPPLAAIATPSPTPAPAPTPAPVVVAKAAAVVVAAPPPAAVTRGKSPTEEWSSVADSPVLLTTPKSGAAAPKAADKSGPTVTTVVAPAPTAPPPTTASARAATATVTTTAAPTPSALSAVVDIDFDDDDDEPAPLDAPPMSPHRAPTVPGPAAAANARAPTATQPANGRPSGAGASSRRPQASASPRTSPKTNPPGSRRGVVPNSDFDLDTDVGTGGKQEAVPVDDDQLVDWASSEETVTSGLDGDRKR